MIVENEVVDIIPLQDAPILQPSLRSAEVQR
jgi:hypothetical protein